MVPEPLRRRRVVLAAPILLLVAFVGLTRLRGGEPVPPPEPFDEIAANALIVDAPGEVSAGSGFEVAVRGAELADGDDVTLIVETAYRTLRTSSPVRSGQATFEIEAIDGPASGIFTLTAISDRLAGSATVDHVAGPAVDPLELFLGPRTIEATNAHATMIVVVAEDEYGNPVEDGTAVDVTVVRPDLENATFTIETDGLLAWSRIISGTLSGRSKVSVSVGDARGKELDFLEIAGSPVPFLVEQVDPGVPADGRSLVRLRTTELADEFGNVLPDGIDVFADVQGPGGTRRLRSQVIGGQAEFTLEAPARPGTETVIVTASGTVSPPLLVAFGPMVTNFSLDATTDRDGIRLDVGPIISTLGAFVPDGTPVNVTTEFGESSHPTFDGEASIVIPDTREPVVVEVLGFERTVQVSP